MSEKELFIWGVIAFALLIIGIVFTVVEFKKLEESP